MARETNAVPLYVDDPQTGERQWLDRAERERIAGERERAEAERRAVERVARVTQDYPLLPVSAAVESPSLPEESGDGLSGAQRVAIAALAAGQTFSSAAREAGVTRKTLYNWRGEPAFARTLDDLSREALATTATRVRNLMLRATRVLNDALAGDDAVGGAIRVVTSAKLWASLEKQAERLEGTGD